MRLYLSSQYWGNQPQRLFDLVGSNTKNVGIITNSGDLFPEEGTLERVSRDVAFLKDNGYTAERLDLREYFGSKDALNAKIKEFGLVWATGGNTFLLRRAMAQSGFDEIIASMLKDDRIVYGGFSAGACVAGSTLKGLEIVDDANSVAEGYSSEVIWEGMSLVNKAIVPHYQSDHLESSGMDEVVKSHEASGIDYLTLSDGEVMIVDGSDTKVLK